MPPPPADAFLEGAPQEQIAALAMLYDRFAHALDPFSEQTEQAERAFMVGVAEWYDSLPPPKPSPHEFRKAIIVRCKRHLAATDRPGGV
jgi:hypothetical protein